MKKSKVIKNKIKNIKKEVIERENKPIDENGYPIPKKVRCFKENCGKEFYLKFSVPQQNYVRKNF